MSVPATMTFVCDCCGVATNATQEIAIGNNAADITCGGCGERWHVAYDVWSLDPLSIGDWTARRMLGVLKNGVFFGKAQLS